ncbi:MAG: GTP-binding protein [Promethearchaeota archaeon]|nr:MAG: GTP-binding protein [Candidatus Lokiarchaeota archaeon]
MKIVVVGPLQSGKSSYIQYLDDKALNVQVKGQNNKYYTVAMDLASLKLNGFDIFLFGTPGLLRFRVMRDLVCNGADGFIFVFDAANPETDEEAISILNSVRKQDVPIIYIANKQDLKEARSPEIIKNQNKLPQECKIFPTSTKTGLNIKESLNYLVNEVYENYRELLQILQNYENNIKGLAEKLNKNKAEMRDFLNSLEIKRFIEIDRIQKTYQVKKGLKNIAI